MAKMFECPECEETFTADRQTRLVEVIQDHAKNVHDMDTNEEDIREGIEDTQRPPIPAFLLCSLMQNSEHQIPVVFGIKDIGHSTVRVGNRDAQSHLIKYLSQAALQPAIAMNNEPVTIILNLCNLHTESLTGGFLPLTRRLFAQEKHSEPTELTLQSKQQLLKDIECSTFLNSVLFVKTEHPHRFCEYKRAYRGEKFLRLEE